MNKYTFILIYGIFTVFYSLFTAQRYILKPPAGIGNCIAVSFLIIFCFYIGYVAMCASIAINKTQEVQ